MALLGEEHTDFHADLAAADDSDFTLDLLGMQQGINAGHDIFAVHAGQRQDDGFSADGHNDLVEAGELAGLGLGIEAHLDVGVLQRLAHHVVLEVLQRPLEIGHTGGDQLTAQLAGLFKQSDLMAAVGGHLSGLHAGRAAADDSDLAGLGHGAGAIFFS